MGDISDWLIEQEMFGLYDNDYNDKKTTRVHLSPSQKKIASIRKQIAMDILNGMSVNEARKKANLTYGKGWRERGLIQNSSNQWSEEELEPFK